MYVCMYVCMYGLTGDGVYCSGAGTCPNEGICTGDRVYEALSY
jgi:hypothetical protein